MRSADSHAALQLPWHVRSRILMGMYVANHQPAAPRPRRRWFSYSLRTLLLVTTLLAIALGAWVSRAERQRRAVAAIRELGGKALYDFEIGRRRLTRVRVVGGDVQYEFELFGGRAAPPGWLCKVLGVDYGADVGFVRMSSATTDAGLVHLSALKSLQVRFLSRTQITDAGLVHLRGLKNLQRLSLDATQVTDAGLVHLSSLANLQDLDLGQTQIVGAGLAHLSALQNLQDLDLSGTQITDDELVHLGSRNNLQILHLDGTLVTATGCDKFRKVVPNCLIEQ